MTITPHSFKQCLGSFATGVTVITVLGPKKEPYGITVNAFASLSLDPPLVLFNLANSASCYKIFRKAKHFTVNILAEDQLPLSQIFAFAKDNKWQGIEFSKGKNQSPVLAGTLAYLECKMFKQYKGGDHTILIGKVTNLHKQPEKKPLLYYCGQYNNVSDVM